jgi:hypothetical protein
MNVPTTTRSRVSRLRISRPALRLIAVFVLAAVSILPAAAEKKVDYIVVLDTSKGMFDSFERSVDLLVEEVLKKQLTAEDNFHLLSFDASPEFEIQRTLTDEPAIKEVLSRLLLLQPLGNHCDLVAALKQTTEYVDELSLNTRKRILLLTQGSHVPPPESPYKVEEDNIARIERLANYIRRNGWELNIVEFPSGSREDSGLGPGSDTLLSKLADELGIPIVRPGDEDISVALAATGAVEIGYPTNTLEGYREFSVPLTFSNHSHEKKTVVIDSATIGEKEVIDSPLSVSIPEEGRMEKNLKIRLSDMYEEGSHSLEIRLGTRQGGPIYPKTGTITLEVKESGVMDTVGRNGRYILYAILFLVILVALFFLIRRLFSSSEEEERTASAGGREAAEMLSGRGGAGRSGSLQESAASYRSGSSDAAEELSARKAGQADSTVADTLHGRSSAEESSRAESTLAQASRHGERGTGEELSSAQQKEESSERAAALSAFRRQSGGNVAEGRAQRLSAYKRGGGETRAARHPALDSAESRRRREAGEMQIELRVDFQRHTPEKNLGWFKDGEERSIGGPGSGADYVISTIPVEGVIAKVRRSGTSFYLDPQNPDYFPEYHVHEGESVLHKRIKVRSPETERITNFFLREWRPTKERLNRYLHMVDEPGTPSDELDPGEV